MWDPPHFDTVSFQPSEVGVSEIFFLFLLVCFFCSIATLFSDHSGGGGGILELIRNVIIHLFM